MTAPVFKVGDKVECEFIKNPNNEYMSPRWNCTADELKYDNGSISVGYVNGIIDSIDEKTISVKFIRQINKPSIQYWSWDINILEEYYNQPGYLRHVIKEVAIQPREPYYIELD